MLIFGFDPGGRSGVAVGRVCNRRIEIATSEALSVDEAVEWLRYQAGDESPHVVGIDAFLFWSSVKGGWRKGDWLLRRSYPSVRNSVLCTNNTYGSMAVQGMAFAFRARQLWPQAVLNEVHPKVLLHAVAGECAYPRNWPSREGEIACEWLARRGCLFADGVRPRTEHAFDAALAVWASYQGHCACWQTDLAELYDGAAIFPVGPVRFFWPEALDTEME